MPCLKPIAITVKTKLKLNYQQVVPCGRCLACLASRRNGWTFRLLEQDRVSTNSLFVTLTYDDQSIPLLDCQSGEIIYGIQNLKEDSTEVYQTLDKASIQKYIKRIRKENKMENMKYYFVGEYGTQTERPHYHAIIFNVEPHLIKKKWNIGISQIDNVSQSSIHYVTKYIMHNDKKQYEKKQRPFALISKGIGKTYVDLNKKYHKENLDELLVYKGGQKQVMPRYLKEKIFEPEELEIINKKKEDWLKENSISYKEKLKAIKWQNIQMSKISKSNKI